MSALVTIHRFTYPTEAHMAQAILESEGIESFIQDELTTQVINVYSNAIGGIKLQVPAEQVEQARIILINAEIITDTTSGNKPKQRNKIEVLDIRTRQHPEKCPFCQSDNIDTVVNPNFLVIVFYFILGVIFPIFKSWEKCYDCRKEWKYKKT